MKIIVNAHKCEIDKTPVNELEINITKCEFEFPEEITNEYVKEAYFTLGTGDTYKQIIVNNECDIPGEVLEKKGTIEIGVVAKLVEGTTEIKRYNPSPAYFNTWKGSLKDAENSEPITPSEFDQYEQALQDGLSEVNQKIEDINEAIEDVNEAITETNNLDLDVDKQGKVATVTLTKKDASTKVVTLSDGTSLMFNWDGTKLGIKTDNDQDYTYVDLQGVQGPIGPKGEAFTIKKTYSSVAEMNADFNNMQLGDYVMIASTVEVEDNAKLYTRGEEQWIFISDFSGATGIRGETGLTPNIQIGTVVSGETPSVTRTGTNENPILNFALVKGDTGATGPTGQTGPTGNGIASITKTATVGLVDTYTITYTNGTTTTFDVTNGEDGDVSPTEFNALKVRVQDLEENQIIDEVEGTSINITNAHNTRTYDFELTKESSQAGTPSPSNPQEVITIKGYENLIGLGTQLNGYRDTLTGNFNSNANSIGYYFETNDLPNIITFGSTNGNRTNVSYYNEVPANGVSSLDYSNSNATSRTITVNKNYSYVHIQFSYNVDATQIIIVEGEEEKKYVPYGNNYVDVKFIGKNILPTINHEFGITSSTGVITSTANRHAYYCPVQEGTTYNISITSIGTASYFYYGFYDSKPVPNLQALDYGDIQSSLPVSKTAPQGAKYLCIFMGTGVSEGVMVSTSNDTTYEPYKENVVPIPLNNNEIAGIGNNLDELIIDDEGYLFLNKKIEKVVLKGTETISKGTDSTYTRYQVKNILPLMKQESGRQEILSNYYYYAETGRAVGIGFAYWVDGGSIFLYPDQSITTADDFKDWLSTHNTVVYYVRQTPQLIDLNTTIDLRLFKGINNITNSETANMKIRYVKSIEDVIDSKQDVLVSGTNIKTINNQSLLGSGNISIGGGGGGTDDYDELSNRPQINSITLTGNKSLADLGIQSEITSSNKLDAGFVDDSLSSNKFVTSTEKTTWNNKSDFSGSYNDLTNKPTLFSGDYNDLTNKPTIPTVPTNVSAFTNDAGYTTNTGTITSVKMNGTTVSSSGEADLGTVITQHQDITGKLDVSKVKTTTSTTSGDVYDVTYINTMLGDIESLLGGI